MIGQNLSHYHILEKLGAGGMGEVYRARDTKLGREVAIKVLPEELSSDKERLIRFEQEARLASSLNHPNIVTIYEVGEEGTTHYIAMELVEGKTLRQVLASGPVSLRKVLDVAAQVADGLSKAHEAGIVHRDLKPENVMVTNEGLVKLLDFGLGKLVPLVAQDISHAPTGSLHGMVMGTVEYMSPEQAGGREVDFRSDQFSLGLILYEMLTGKRAFHRETAVQTLSAIIEDEPEPVVKVNPKVPEPLRWIIERCLAKGPEDRYGSTRDLARELQSVRGQLSEASANVVAVSRPRVLVRRQTWIAVLAFVVLALVAVALYFQIRQGEVIDSIAVLPFVNASGDPEMEYLSDGITESIINSLSEVSRIRVIARSSVFRFKGREIDSQAVGRELKVKALVTGRLVQRGDSLQVRAELVDARDNSSLWSGRYDQKMSDILTIQDEIAGEIVEKLRLKLTGEEKKRLSKRPTENPEAYQPYVKGRYWWFKATLEDVRKLSNTSSRRLKKIRALLWLTLGWPIAISSFQEATLIRRKRTPRQGRRQ